MKIPSGGQTEETRVIGTSHRRRVTPATIRARKKFYAKRVKLQHERRANGLCITCGDDGEGFARCKPCRAKHAGHQREFVGRRLARGECLWCGVPVNRFRLCLKCRKHRVEKFG